MCLPINVDNKAILVTSVLLAYEQIHWNSDFPSLALIKAYF